MRLGIVGSRRRNSMEDFKLVKDKVIELNPERIVSGGCKEGGDDFAEEIAAEFNIPIDIYKPKLPSRGSSYSKFVKAYHNRNATIGWIVDKLIALVSDDRTGGTENTIKYFLEFNDEENLILL